MLKIERSGTTFSKARH